MSRGENGAGDAPKEDGTRPNASDPASSETNGQSGQGGRPPDQTAMLLNIAVVAHLFKTPRGDAYAEVPLGNRREVWPVDSGDMRGWLELEFLNRNDRAPGRDALNSAIATLSAKARHRGATIPVAVRVARHAGCLYLDLADDARTIIEVDSDGWRATRTCPVRFKRPDGIKPLPMPTSGGSVDELRPFLASATDDQFVLIVAFCLAVLNPGFPCPLLGLSGEAGSGKTETTRFVRTLLDPNEAPFRELRNDIRNLYIAGSNSRALAFDNESSLSERDSDRLAKFVTGTSDALRKHYENDKEQFFEVCAAIIINGIEDIVTRDDLVDRAILIELPQMSDEQRVDKEDLYEQFRQAHPRILGALLDGVARGLANRTNIKPKSLPRMADFFRWVSACEPAYWPTGTFERAYAANRREAAGHSIDASAIASTIESFMQDRVRWQGEASELLRLLSDKAFAADRLSRHWPQSAVALGQKLTRAKTSLAKLGIEVEKFRVTNRRRSRMIALTRRDLTDVDFG